jgi:hypothetical protein
MPDAKGHTAAPSLNPSSNLHLLSTVVKFPDKGAELFSGAKDMIEEGATQFKEKLGALGDVDVAELSKKATKTLRKNPGKSLLIAVGVGLALGVALRLISR